MPYQIRLATLKSEREAQAERLEELKAPALEATTEDGNEKFAFLIQAATMSLSDMHIVIKSLTERQEQAMHSQDTTGV